MAISKLARGGAVRWHRERIGRAADAIVEELATLRAEKARLDTMIPELEKMLDQLRGM